MSKEKKETKEECNEEIKEMGIVRTKTERGTIHCLNIIGQIEGHQVLSPQTKTTKYEHVLPQLISVEQDHEVDGLLVLLNTVGGDVEAGLAIAEMIATMSKPSVSLVLGGGHSIGVPLAVATDVSFITPSATMTIHPIRMNGLVIGVTQTFDYLNRMQDRIVSFVCRNAAISEQAFLNLMLETDELANDVGTILFGKDAVERQLIDRLGGLSDAIDTLYGLIAQHKENSKLEKNAPK